jgi:hypothetical protein
MRSVCRAGAASGHAADKGDEVASPNHSITSSARAMSTRTSELSQLHLNERPIDNLTLRCDLSGHLLQTAAP